MPTMQAVWQTALLAAAVLFIFAGVPVWALVACAPAAVLLALPAVHVAHAELARRHRARLRHEYTGWLAEAWETALLLEPHTVNHKLVSSDDQFVMDAPITNKVF